MRHNSIVTREDFFELLEFGNIIIDNKFTGLLGIEFFEKDSILRISGTTNRVYSTSLEHAKVELENIIEQFELIQQNSCFEFKELSSKTIKVYLLLFREDKNPIVVGKYSEGVFKWGQFVK